MKKHIRYTVLLLVGLALTGCSTTKRIPDGEILYTGVKKMTFTPAADSLELSDRAVSAVKEPLSVKPNNPLYSPYVRTPLPIGLWAWNYLYTEKQKGFKHWLFNRLAKDPVLISKVRPELRVQVADQIWENYGYFGVQMGYELIPNKHKPDKKAKVSYFGTIPAPHTYDSIAYAQSTGAVGHILDSLQTGSLVRVGAVYNLDTLVAERVRISNAFRSLGYYYFRPEFIQYQADTTQAPYKVELRMRLNEDIPAAALKPYKVGNISIALFDPVGERQDTMTLNGMEVSFQQPLKIRPNVLAGTIDLTPGELVTLQDQNSTQTKLNRLGIFSSVSLALPPLDSLAAGADSLDVKLSATFDRKYEANFEVDVNSKSNSYLGPGVIFGMHNKNLFKGGEVFSLRLTGSYEWQTGNKRQYDKSTAINSYEVGLNASLTLPGIVTPVFRRRNTKYISQTNFALGVDLLNRPKYFTMLSASGSAGYDFKTSPYSSHNFTVFRLAYNNLLRTSADFDSTMVANPAIALSFNNQFIPSMSYTYTYDRTFGKRSTNRFVWQTTVSEAGNILAGIYDVFGSNGTKKIFGSPFSQFVKATTEFKVYHQVGQHNTLVSRLFVGAGHAYGNSEVMPYSEQFYTGGANSIRGFTVRSLGPGSYRAPEEQAYSYWDQTGTFKLEANLEFRFRILGGLNGAVFVDAGNIWLLKNDPARKADPNDPTSKDYPGRPGGKLGKDFFKQVALGAGIGLRYDLSFLVVRLDFGVGLHFPYATGKRGYFNMPNFKDARGLYLAIGYPF